MNKPEAVEGEESKTPAELAGLEINKDKISPDFAMLSRSQFKTITEIIDFIKVIRTTYPPERQLQFIINDNKFDSYNGALVDMAFGLGFEYL